jgi:hypothetical protein
MQSRIRDQIRLYHVVGKQYCCSGTKQLKVIIALYDNDVLLRQSPCKLLHRSAQLLREHVVPALNSAHNEIDRNIRMILDDKVVKFVNAESLKAMSLRRVGNLLYTQSFAEMLFQEIIVCNCKISAAIPRLLMHMHQAGCQLGNLLPVHTRYWWPIVEDIVMSPGVETLRLKLLDELESHTEYTAISVDATLRCCMPVMGQSNHRNAVLRLSDSAFDDADSLRRVLSIKGRTGAVVALLPIVSEKAECVAQAIADNLTKKAKEQVKYFFCDNPSPKLCSALSDILPIFEGMCLDPVHLPITYEYSTWSASSCNSFYNIFDSVDGYVFF